MYLVQICTNKISYPEPHRLHYTYEFRQKGNRFPEYNTQLGFRG